MLKKKYYTTPLIRPEERPPLKEFSAAPPSIFRILGIAGKLLLLLFDLLRSKFSRQLTSTYIAVKLRHFLEIFGGMWIKLGQVLCMRSDLFSIEFCNELSHLQDHAFVFPSEHSIEIIEENLGCPINDVFEHFEPRPFAAASLSQVHKARLKKKKRWVVVKVQRPFAAEYFRYDFWWLSLYFGLLKYFHVMENFQWGDLLNEIRQMMEEELDYRYEATNMKRLRKTLKEDRIYVPKVYLKYNTRVLLVMEFLQGVFLSDYVMMKRSNFKRLQAWSDTNKFNPKKVARRLWHSIMRQLYEDLVFHGDLHPGNILLLKKNRLAFIDFGNVGMFDAEFAASYDQYSRALTNGELSKAADLILIILGKLPVVDIATVKKELVKVFEKQNIRSSVKNLSFHEKSMAGNTGEINKIFSKYRFEINWNLLKLGRTIGAIDQNIGILNPGIDYYKESRSYYIQAEKRKMCKNIRQIPNLIEKAANFSGIVMPIVRRSALQFDGWINIKNQMTTFIFRMLSCIFLILSLGVVWVYLYQHHFSMVAGYYNTEGWFTNYIQAYPHIPRVGWYLFFIFLVGMIIKLTRFAKSLSKTPVRLPGDTRVL